MHPFIINHRERRKRITQQALDLFEDKTETQRWLNTPKLSLNHQTPLNAITTDTGAEQVEQLLHRAEYGIYG